MSETHDALKTKKTPWPTKKAMEQVYDMNLWGTHTTPFYSGEGSHHPEFVHPYVEAVTSFLTSFDKALVVCDLGCGDFNIGKNLVKHTANYIAVDIVANLIAHNRATFIANNLEFQCLDLAVDELPQGDCAILRQVLQHISNAEIQCVLAKLKHFKYIILTEHLPVADFIPNIDIISGQGIRLKKQSGVNVLVSPFNFEVKNERLLSSIILKDGKGVIETKLYELF
ncbi:class I SAM-dependent methyltransferase [Psychroserpens damuponensis]|uniref:class I SAM-dependent methyltransferase n=1 Tax=Psychroserpens damuponensis TaxID=943936 RepID=UPI00058C5E94|nr:class I SAM-dependent methyltransferase [Psychroserpens damuponensis]